MRGKTRRPILTFAIIAVATFISMTFNLSENAFAAVVAPGVGIAHPAIVQPVAPLIGLGAPRPAVAPKPGIAPRPAAPSRPIVEPFFNPFFNPFLFNEAVNPFFFNGFVAE
jgi:hypothetical protein